MGNRSKQSLVVNIFKDKKTGAEKSTTFRAGGAFGSSGGRKRNGSTAKVKKFFARAQKKWEMAAKSQPQKKTFKEKIKSTLFRQQKKGA